MEFFRKLLDNSENLSNYVDSLYLGNEYSANDLDHIFGVLKGEGLIVCVFADDRAWVKEITFEGKHFFDEENRYRIVALCKKADNIANEYYPSSGKGYSTAEVSNRERIYQGWLQDVNHELREIYDRTKDHYIWETLNTVTLNTGEMRTLQSFFELRGRLEVICRNIEKYYSNNDMEKIENESEVSSSVKNKNPKIFISHTHADSEYVKHIVNLLIGMGLNQTQVFCSSFPGFDIPIDLNIFDYLKKQFLDYNLHVIFIHSKNYYKSNVSLNEMGAAWVLRNDVTSILLPGFDFDQMTGVVNKESVSIKLDTNEIELKDKLNQLHNKIVEEFGLVKQADIIWEENRNSFIESVRQLDTHITD